jgi:hypothetical protein
MQGAMLSIDHEDVGAVSLPGATRVPMLTCWRHDGLLPCDLVTSKSLSLIIVWSFIPHSLGVMSPSDVYEPAFSCLLTYFFLFLALVAIVCFL